MDTEGHFIYNASYTEELICQMYNAEPDLSPLDDSPTFQAMVASMLRKYLPDRPTVDKVLKMEWWDQCKRITSPSHAGLSRDEANKLSKELTKQEEGGKKSSAHEALTEDLAKFQNFASQKKLNDIFKALDLNQDGFVELEEAKASLSKHVPPHRVEPLLSALFHSSETITYTQFMAKMIGQNRLMKGIFQTFDRNNDGSLDRGELALMLEKIPALKRYLAEDNIDVDGDGVIEMWEITSALRRALTAAD